jgi:hypothetical protein
MDADAVTVARLPEPVAMLWIHLAVTPAGWGVNFAYGILRR